MINFKDYIDFLQNQHDISSYNQGIKSAINSASKLLDEAKISNNKLENHPNFDDRITKSINKFWRVKSEIDTAIAIVKDIVSAIDIYNDSIAPKFQELYNIILNPPYPIQEEYLNNANNLLSQRDQAFLSIECKKIDKDIQLLILLIKGDLTARQTIEPKFQELHNILLNPSYPIQKKYLNIGDNLLSKKKQALSLMESEKTGQSIDLLIQTIQSDLTARQTIEPKFQELHNILLNPSYPILKKSLDSANNLLNQREQALSLLESEKIGQNINLLIQTIQSDLAARQAIESKFETLSIVIKKRAFPKVQTRKDYLKKANEFLSRYSDAFSSVESNCLGKEIDDLFEKILKDLEIRDEKRVANIANIVLAIITLLVIFFNFGTVTAIATIVFKIIGCIIGIAVVIWAFSLWL